VGFAVSGVGTWAFPFRVPEGEWTHLAFVSSPAAAIPTDNPEAPGLNATLGATNGANLGATNGGGEAKGRGAPPTNPAGGPKPPVGPGGANAARIEGPWGRRKSVSNKVGCFQIAIRGRICIVESEPFPSSHLSRTWAFGTLSLMMPRALPLRPLTLSGGAAVRQRGADQHDRP
jgi:hypothetical protein